MYYVIALGLFRAVSAREVLRCLVEGLRWMPLPVPLRVPGKSSISRARARLGVAPFEVLRDERVRPVGERGTRGVWFREWRLIGFDGSTLSVPDEAENREAFGLPGERRGRSAFPQVRLTGLMELGTRACIAWTHGPIRESEIAQAERLVDRFAPGMLVVADRNYAGYPLWRRAMATGADLLWRVPSRQRLPVQRRLDDGSFLSEFRGVAGIAGVLAGPAPSGWLPTVFPMRTKRYTGWLPRCWIRIGHRPPSWRRCITSAGNSRPATTRSRATCSAPVRACAARPRSWCARKWRDCSSPTTRSATSCIKPRARRTKIPTTSPSCMPCESCAVGWWPPAISPLTSRSAVSFTSSLKNAWSQAGDNENPAASGAGPVTTPSGRGGRSRPHAIPGTPR